MYKLLVILSILALGNSSYSQGISFLEKAKQAERWIRTQEVHVGNGLAWRAAAGDTTIVTNLYSGTTGVILFYLELYQTTHDTTYLNRATQGADYVISTLKGNSVSFDEVGLYTGEAGVAFMLNKVYEVTHRKKYGDAAAKSFKRLTATAKISGTTASWRYNDIVYGGAGIGLMLLQMKGSAPARQLAIQTGNGLIQAGLDAPGGKKWFMDTAMVRQQYYMPNFSHGTAGVSYFLARLYQETDRKEFLYGALAGAKHLEAIENKDAWVYHHDKEDGKNLYYLSWCHGPAGTARLYYLLHKITKDESWKNKIRKSAEALMKCGIPARELPGYWNNVSACCGTASVAAFFLDLYELLGDEQYMAFSMELTMNLISRGTAEGTGVKWVQAEHRRRPELLQAQTGYMQGAAGIGMWFLRLHESQNHLKRGVLLPDDPFGK